MRKSAKRWYEVVCVSIIRQVQVHLDNSNDSENLRKSWSRQVNTETKSQWRTHLRVLKILPGYTFMNSFCF